MKKLLFLFFLFPAAIHGQQIIYVKHDASGLNNGSSWANAFTDLRLALAQSGPGKEIWVSRGAYAPESQNLFDTPSGFRLSGHIRMLGGFEGTETEASQRDWQNNETILTAWGDTTSSLNVIYCRGTDTSSLIDGFTIRDGNAYTINPWAYTCDQYVYNYACNGGGIFMHSTSVDTPTVLTIRNCRFFDNGAFSGGAISANFFSGVGGFTLYNCEFDQNTSSESASSIYIGVGFIAPYPIRIDSCRFLNGYSYLTTGAISLQNYSQNLDFKISRSLFFRNRAQYNVGAVQMSSAAQSLLEDCVFLENGTDLDFSVSGISGAVNGGRYKLKNCRFIRNRSKIGGVINGGNIEIIGCLFEGNRAELEGGVISLHGNSHIVNSTFANNYCAETGGVIDHGNTGSDTIVNCLFVNNRAGISGDFVYSSGYMKMYIANSYIDAADCEALQSGIESTDELVCGPGMIFLSDPMLRDTASGDYRLAGCSPLLDRGDSTWAARFGLISDLAGAPRLQNQQVDIGAYETRAFVAAATQRDVSCFGAADGWAALTPTGGYGPFAWLWSHGAPDSLATLLAPGLYTGSLTDSDGCADTLSVVILETDSLHIETSTSPNTELQQPNGSVAATVSGGTAPYQYAWSTGDSTASVNQLAAGIYTLTITDSQQCSKVTEVVVGLVVGTLEADKQTNVSVSPNPVSGLLTIRAQDAICCTLLSPEGRVVAKQDYTSGTGTLDMRHLPAGIYLLRVETRRGVEVVRVARK